MCSFWLAPCPSHAVARGCRERLLGVAVDWLPERQVKPQLQGKLQSLDTGKLVFWPGCHGDRQAAAAREEGTAASPTSRILRQPWWGRGLDTSLSPPDMRVPACPSMLRLTGCGELSGSQKETWQRWLLKLPFPASGPVPSRWTTVASCSAFGANRSSSAELLGPGRLPELPSWISH